MFSGKVILHLFLIVNQTNLTCSLVLRCDDCVKYHLGKCKEISLTTEEVHEAMGVATLIGGTIVIPHLRRAFEFWDELMKG